MNARVIGFILGIPLGALSTGLVVFLSMPPALDEPIRTALQALGSPLPYEQYVETTVDIGERRLVIRGRYFVDHSRRAYDSAATSTLFLREGSVMGVFSVANRVIGDDVYTQVLADAALPTAVPHDSAWHHFRRGGIPREFVDIASDRPILDNLVLLRGEGAYLTLEKKHGITRFGDGELLRYTFRLSPTALEIRDGTMGAIVNRIGETGAVDLWLTPEGELRHITLVGALYAATTTIADVNSTRILSAPL